MSKKCGIYKITNLTNGKMYIGQAKDIEKRWSKHKYSSQKENQVLYRAIRKYGIENFEFEIIQECDIKELDNLEIYYIQYYNTYIHSENSNGYNMTIGGDATRGNKLSEETKLKISKANKGREKTETEIQKIKNSRKTRPIVQLSLDGQLINTYSNSCEILVKNEEIKDCKGIRECCKKTSQKRRTAYGYIWMYQEDYVKWDGDVSYYIDNKKNTDKRKVYQYDLSNNFIQEYESCSDASRKLNIKTQYISDNCIGGRKSTCGYIFRYEKI